jgi:prepilin-type N-terminal cleavage/methylation domain-containing protein
MLKTNKILKKGVTLIEIVVCVGIFAILSASVYGVFVSVINGITYYRERTIISFLSNQYLEIVKNMSYSSVGTLEGNPHGNLPDLPNPVYVQMSGNEYEIYYAVSYVDDPVDGQAIFGTDPSPNDYKQVKLYVKNINKNTTNSFLTNISPRGLEALEDGGVLYIKVFDAVGQPVPGATINIKNTNITPNINLTRITNEDGDWVEVSLPMSDNSYEILVTKDGYSLDKTYSISESNPSPVKPDATISNGQVTQISFSIDKLSNLTIYTLNRSCSSVPEIGVGVRGAKLIGLPDIYKFEQEYVSNLSGQIALNGIEWDNYTPGLNEDNYMIYGSSPIQETNVLPDVSQIFTIIIGPKTANSLLVVVKDASTGNPIESAEVILQQGMFSDSGFTNGSVWSQQEWSGGSGQEDFIDTSKYYQDNGGVSTNEIPSGLRLFKNGENYVSSGILTSSSFDTGTNQTSFTTLNWQPTSQDPLTEIKFQIAANNDNETWNFIGPDGTNQTYYTTPGTTITNANNNRYIRYRVFLSTFDNTKTPVLTSVNINYISGCATPGQVMFPDLQSGSAEATINMSGYESQTISNLEIDGYNVLQVYLSQ